MSTDGEGLRAQVSTMLEDGYPRELEFPGFGNSLSSTFGGFGLRRALTARVLAVKFPPFWKMAITETLNFRALEIPSLPLLAVFEPETGIHDLGFPTPVSTFFGRSPRTRA